MAVKLGHRWSKGKATIAELIMGTLAAADSTGCTSDELIALLPAGTDLLLLQPELEELVARGAVVRRGVGRGALYALDSRQRTRLDRLTTRREDDSPLKTFAV